MTRTTKRLPRFRRNAEDAAAIKLTLRDKEIIHQISIFRFLRSTQIFQLIEGGRVQIIRRLKALYHHGWLDRPRCQIDFYHRGGSKPLVYGLSPKGAGLARSELGISQGWKRWRGEKSVISRLFLDHTLMIADILITVEAACRHDGRNMLFIPSRILEGESLPKETLHWSAWLDGIPVGLVPDAVFAIEVAGAGGRRDRVICFLEADRGTMPIRRADKHQSSIGRKLSAYAALWKDGTFKKQFGTGRFAVFLVTPGRERAAKLREAADALPSGSGLFSCHPLDEVMQNPGAVLERCAGRDNDIRI